MGEIADTISDLTSAGKPTAGPWLAAAKPSSIVGWPVVSPAAGGRSICNVSANDDAQANAHLIAAAPDMLAALQFTRQELAPLLNDDRHSRMVRDRINTAIAKAEGKAVSG